MTGTYFKDIYADLMKLRPDLPAGDPAPNLPDCLADNYVNFTRAEKLAREHDLPPEIAKRFQEMAILQYFWDYKGYANPSGLVQLGNDFNLSQPERLRLITLIFAEHRYPCFSFSQNTEMAIDENWTKKQKKMYAPAIRKFTGERLSLCARIKAWFARPFA